MVRLSTSLLLVTSLIASSTVSAAGGPALPHAPARARSHGGSDFNHPAVRRHPNPARYEAARAVEAKRANNNNNFSLVKKDEGEKDASPKKRRKVLRRAAVNALDKVSKFKRGDGQGGKVCVIKNSDGSNATTTLAAATATTAVSSTVSIVSTSTTASSVASSSAAASSSATVASATTVSSSSSSAYSSSAAETSSSVADTNNAYISISIGLGGDSSTSTSTTYSATSTSTTAAAATSSSTSSSSGSLTPNGNKAGVAGGDSLPWIASELGWWYDWSATPSNSNAGSAVAVPMLWGDGAVDSTDASRLAAFKALTSTPTYIIGYEEPDCAAGSGSAGFGYTTGITLWDSLVAPMGAKGSLLVSPSMCKQAAESGWLQPFQSGISRDWDITNLHINKNSMDGVKKDLDHYWNTYGKPMWVTEFACVDDSSDFIPCTDQTEINQFISDIVTLFESDSRVYAYAYSDGYGLGSVWPTVSNGALSASGSAYLAALKAR